MFSDYFRGYQYIEPLRQLGVEVRRVNGFSTRKVEGVTEEEAFLAMQKAEKARLANEPGWEQHLDGVIEYNVDDIRWADVVVFRRYFNTSFACATRGANLEVNGCNFVTQSQAEAQAHPHGFREQDNITRALWPNFRDINNWSGGIVYETDDNHFSIKRWNGYYGDVIAEQGLITDMARHADIVTVATPRLAQTYGRYNPNIRVVRNAIDPTLYVKDKPRPEGDKPRLVYYGSVARMRDYAGLSDNGVRGYARAAVDAHKSEVRRVFLGTEQEPMAQKVIDTLFDENHPKITGIAEFAKGLANLHGDIGIAPLGGDEFDACKSELHWLEYAATDMAFIGERFNSMKGDLGPYGVVRDGVDGLLARGSGEWREAVRKLVRSKDLREQLAGAAKERVLATYDFRQRAAEWADVFRFAAENAGIGRRRVLQAA